MVLVKSHPVYCLEQLPNIVALFPEGTTLYQVFCGGPEASWDDVEISAGRTLEPEEGEVCVRMYGLHDDQCRGLSSVLASLLSPSTHSVPTVVRTPKRPRSSSSSSSSRSSPLPVIESQGTSSVRAERPILSNPSIKAIPVHQQPILPHSRKCSLDSLRVTYNDHCTDTDEPSSKRRRCTTPSANFPSQYPFSAVFDFVGRAELSGLQQQDALAVAERETGFKCGKTAFGEIKRLLRQGSSDIWEDYRSRVGINALWTVYKRDVSLRPHNSAQLPWREKGPVLTPGERLVLIRCLMPVLTSLVVSCIALEQVPAADNTFAHVHPPPSSFPIHPTLVNMFAGQVTDHTSLVVLPTDPVPSDGHPDLHVTSAVETVPTSALTDFLGSVETSHDPLADSSSGSPLVDGQNLLDFFLSDDTIFGAQHLPSSSDLGCSVSIVGSDDRSELVHNPDLVGTHHPSLPIPCEYIDNVACENAQAAGPSEIHNDIVSAEHAYSELSSHSYTLDQCLQTPVVSEREGPSTAVFPESTAFTGLVSQYGSWTLSSSSSDLEPLESCVLSADSSLAFALNSPSPQ